MPRSLSRLPPIDAESGYLNVVIETPGGCQNKYKYDEESGFFVFDKALPIGQSFAFDFGFLPSTVGDDGDPLDVLVFVDQPSFPGCLIKARLLGVIEAEQSADGKMRRNDRFLAVPVEIKSQKPPAQSPSSMEEAGAERIGDFFVAYNKLQGKQFNVLRYANSHRAMELISAGIAKAKRQNRRRSAK
jgi:inorganic pyrophosphatase